MTRWRVSLAFILLTILLGMGSFAQAQGEKQVYMLTVDGVIDPFVARHVRRGIEVAAAEGAQCLIIKLDTPGGTDKAMRDIVQGIMNSPIPIVVYVAPSGARAASAGLFITLAAHIAAMAPGTNIGGAHPVTIGPYEMPSTMEKKVVEDASAYIRAIAERRGRNSEWAGSAVRESISATAEEALEKGIVDLVADDLTSLLRQIEGKEVASSSGRVKLSTSGASVRELKMPFTHSFLHTLIDPNIAYLLLVMGMTSIAMELRAPGISVPGVAGVISLLLAFTAFGSLPINWGGVALIVLGGVLFLLDIKAPGIWLSIAGAIAFAIGSLLLFTPQKLPSPAMPLLRVSRWLVALMTAAMGGFFLLVLSAGMRALRLKPISGVEAGTGGVALSDLNLEGIVRAGGESWSATAVEGEIRKGEQVEVVGVEGTRLKVRWRRSAEKKTKGG